MTEWVYAIGTGQPESPIKIGLTTTHPDKRIRELQTGNPDRLKVLKAWQTWDSARDEARMHQLLALKRIPGGEWFRADMREVLEAWQSVSGSRGRFLGRVWWVRLLSGVCRLGRWTWNGLAIFGALMLLGLVIAVA